ncbi:hypothetical protein B0T16DRAFT_421812 [Cercophora newfieldiana]|uniref:Uncharacterized protein n=1 Tax=Cercophora newfieldiana TaxID=92897 RepID=A0AA39XRJ0_9PEZI|nr:hypothetical protein B0T16DRAFT_421812 [Cercophora newfieldiana]
MLHHEAFDASPTTISSQHTAAPAARSREPWAKLKIPSSQHIPISSGSPDLNSSQIPHHNPHPLLINTIPSKETPSTKARWPSGLRQKAKELNLRKRLR